MAAPSVSISADPATIKQGQCANLAGSTADAPSASIDQGIGKLDPNGSRQVCPGSTTQYTITAMGEGGTRTASTTVTGASEGDQIRQEVSRPWDCHRWPYRQQGHRQIQPGPFREESGSGKRVPPEARHDRYPQGYDHDEGVREIETHSGQFDGERQVRKQEGSKF